MPSIVPIAEPIAWGKAMRRQIARLGIVIRARSRGAVPHPRVSF